MFKQKRKLLVILIVVLSVSAGVAFILIRGKGLNPDSLLSSRAANNKIQETGSQSLSSTPAQAVDSDGDGLTDQEEKELKTDPYKADTDGDGLFDREEVKVYQTDPLKPDTDGDKVSDGEEIKARNNPKGEGQLFDINVAIEKLNNR